MSQTRTPAVKLPSLEGTKPVRMGRRYRVLVVLPVLAVFLFAAAFWQFVHFAVMANPALNGLIFLVMAWGASTMFGHVLRIYREDAVFRDGLLWLRKGAIAVPPATSRTHRAYVMGMIERLAKMGLGHQVYVHSSVMGPELDSLEQYLDKKQELSQFLVGLMVALGLLGTFVGLLETLVQTSSLIGTIAKSSGAGNNMEQEFAKIVGGLQGPLTAMGTAFSASMFGLVGSITLGFQMVIVRKTAQDFVERVRREVLSLAEKNKANAHAEVTEQFLSSLLTDILQAHQRTSDGLASVIDRLDAMLPEIRRTATVTAELVQGTQLQQKVLEQAAEKISTVALVIPSIASLANASTGILEQVTRSNARIEKMLALIPAQAALTEDIGEVVARINRLSTQVGSLEKHAASLGQDVRQQAEAVRRMDGVLWNVEKDQLRGALDTVPKR
ncbi:hypothetical protein IMCC9480_1486 [Oxalobacteraceae bacterium IMCC9480]|nr:hypothetical protein IMCC9480_1486 [Oxalobacteraceae bacterium IMCC9480]NDP60444.1 hypothetical protein [Oxalobacteraceae bacterium]